MTFAALDEAEERSRDASYGSSDSETNQLREMLEAEQQKVRELETTLILERKEHIVNVDIIVQQQAKEFVTRLEAEKEKMLQLQESLTRLNMSAAKSPGISSSDDAHTETDHSEADDSKVLQTTHAATVQTQMESQVETMYELQQKLQDALRTIKMDNEREEQLHEEYESAQKDRESFVNSISSLLSHFEENVSAVCLFVI